MVEAEEEEEEEEEEDKRESVPLSKRLRRLPPSSPFFAEVSVVHTSKGTKATIDAEVIQATSTMARAWSGTRGAAKARRLWRKF